MSEHLEQYGFLKNTIFSSDAFIGPSCLGVQMIRFCFLTIYKLLFCSFW